MTPVVRTVALSKHFGRNLAVDQVDWAVDEGSVYALLGPNGAGKTTALRMLMNIIEPTSGYAEVLDTDSRRLKPRHWARIGYVAEGQDLPHGMTVGGLLAYLRPFYPTWDEVRARELVDHLALPCDRKLKDLSRGMRMKAALAAALAYRPALVVLDEPLAGLDPLTRDQVIEEFVDSARQTTIVISSHDLADIESFATHIGYLDRGRLRISETLTSLTDRFREIEVTSEIPVALPDPWPAQWLAPEQTGTVLRFIETRFDPDRSLGDLQATFDEPVAIAAHPLSLRAIFIALARADAPPS